MVIITQIELLNSLKEYLKEKTKNLILTARAEKNSLQEAKKPPFIFIGDLPQLNERTTRVPYILIKLVQGKDELDESTCNIRIIAVTYNRNNDECYMECLNVIEKIRENLLKDVVVGERFLCRKPLEYLIYEDDIKPYCIGELMTVWEIPQVMREVDF